jgi:hypothetical protein
VWAAAVECGRAGRNGSQNPADFKRFGSIVAPWLTRLLEQRPLPPLSKGTVMLLIIVIILLLIWAPGYYGYGRHRWGLGYGGHFLTILLVILVLWLLFARGGL